MTPEDKILMTKVLCEQLPHGVKIRIEYPFIEEKDWHPEALCGLDLSRQVIAGTSIRIEEFKPYLRPLPSMTEDEALDIIFILKKGIAKKDILKVVVENDGIRLIIDDGVCSTIHDFTFFSEIVKSLEVFDYLNSRHFDIRGLLRKKLAVVAYEGLYV